jgi:hypothetical protein
MPHFHCSCATLQVAQQCVGTEGVEPEYIKTEVLPEFFRCFWQRRMALDRRNYRALVETTVALANKVRAWLGLTGIVRMRKLWLWLGQLHVQMQDRSTGSACLF